MCVKIILFERNWFVILICVSLLQMLKVSIVCLSQDLLYAWPVSRKKVKMMLCCVGVEYTRVNNHNFFQSSIPKKQFLDPLTLSLSCPGPIYHELEPGEIEEILASIDVAPPIPPRDRPPKPRDPVYERIDSVRRTMHRKLTLKLSTTSQVVTRISVDGAYIISKCGF